MYIYTEVYISLYMYIWAGMGWVGVAGVCQGVVALALALRRGSVTAQCLSAVAERQVLQSYVNNVWLHLHRHLHARGLHMLGRVG